MRWQKGHTRLGCRAHNGADPDTGHEESRTVSPLGLARSAMPPAHAALTKGRQGGSAVPNNAAVPHPLELLANRQLDSNSGSAQIRLVEIG